MMKGLFAYESAYRDYTRACIEDFVEDNIQWAEIRPNFMGTNQVSKDDGEGPTFDNAAIMQIIQDELNITMDKINADDGKYFGGMKVIYCTPRSFEKPTVKGCLDECLELKLKYPKLLCGKSSKCILTITVQQTKNL